MGQCNSLEKLMNCKDLLLFNRSLKLSLISNKIPAVLILTSLPALSLPETGLMLKTNKVSYNFITFSEHEIEETNF